MSNNAAESKRSSTDEQEGLKIFKSYLMMMMTERRAENHKRCYRTGNSGDEIKFNQRKIRTV